MTDPSPRRRDYSQGLPDHHDPTAGIGGARPAQSALTLRLVLAVFGFVVCVVLGFLLLRVADVPRVFGIALLVLAVVAAVDIVVIVRRKRRGEPG